MLLWAPNQSCCCTESRKFDLHSQWFGCSFWWGHCQAVKLCHWAVKWLMQQTRSLEWHTLYFQFIFFNVISKCIYISKLRDVSACSINWQYSRMYILSQAHWDASGWKRQTVKNSASSMAHSKWLSTVGHLKWEIKMYFKFKFVVHKVHGFYVYFVLWWNLDVARRRSVVGPPHNPSKIHKHPSWKL